MLLSYNSPVQEASTGVHFGFGIVQLPLGLAWFHTIILQLSIIMLLSYNSLVQEASTGVHFRFGIVQLPIGLAWSRIHW